MKTILSTGCRLALATTLSAPVWGLSWGTAAIASPSVVDESPLDMGAMPKTYMTLDALETTMQQWAAKAPQIMQFRVYAQSNSYDQFYLRLSAAVSTGEKLPSVLIDAATHGDEVISTATVVGVLHTILSQYGRNPEITELVKTRDIYFIPALCADGYAKNSRIVEGGTDPNRSYPYPGNMENKPSQCIRAAMDLFEEVGFNATINYHASGRMVLLPWGYTRTPFNDGNFAVPFKALGKKLGDLTGYSWGQIPDEVGYTAPGGSSDWYYIRGKELGFHTAAFAVEVGTSKRPSTSAIQTEVNMNNQALVTFAKEGPVLFAPAFLDNYAGTPELAWPKRSAPSAWFVPGEE